MEEIERKFLVNKLKWDELEKGSPIYIKQGYISKNQRGIVRVRIKNDKSFLTIKSANTGIVRSEFEYEIPFREAEKIFSLFCDTYIEKYRYEICFKNKVWEVDEFLNPKQKFILAEVELKHKDEKIEIPNWIESEVSNDPLYFNSNLI